MALRYFAEVHFGFLIVGHTHDDIDQQFSIISSTLKEHDIDLLKEMLKLIQHGALYMKAFTPAELMENIWDWKEFITPHLDVDRKVG